MMLGVSGLMNSSGDGGGGGGGGLEGHDSGDASGGSSEVGGPSSIPVGFSEEDKVRIMEEGDRSVAGGNRWPRQETMSLLKIRSEMAVAFRDSSLKGPLWDEVSRKMADLGYQRSSKKCKEKFENLYKYHKRTKEGRASKPDGKTYRFFDQLEALESNPSLPLLPALRPPPPPQPTAVVTMAGPPMLGNTSVTVSISTPANPISVAQNIVTQVGTNLLNPPFSSLQPPPLAAPPPMSAMFLSQSHTFQPSHGVLSNSTSSSTSSDEGIQRRTGRKRKWKDFFEKLMKDVIDKQEDLQRKFLETLEKRESDRMAKEEAWRAQELARMNREHELLAQERSIAAAKDAAVIAFLQKISDQQNLQIPINIVPPIPVQVPKTTPPPPQPTPPPPPPAPAPTQALVVATLPSTKASDTPKTDNGGENFLPSSSSRWPKAEVQALIDLRTSLDLKYQESGPKGPMWEEISAAMGKIGYNRSSKRCKEKWENINKYFKKVKESNKRRPEDSKTCPYFHQLDAIYREKSKIDPSVTNPAFIMKPENPMLPIMARPEQQWPLPDHGRENVGENDHDDDDGDDEEDDDDEGRNYEIVTNKQPSPTTKNTIERVQ